jgi:hypothetical protein
VVGDGLVYFILYHENIDFLRRGDIGIGVGLLLFLFVDESWVFLGGLGLGL